MLTYAAFLQRHLVDNLKIVLVNTTHPGNIGSTARAMKTMGLRNLCLVKPKQFPHAKANELASGAHDILTETLIFDSLTEAIADCELVIGTSARVREIPMPELNPEQAASKAVNLAQTAKVAIVFGRESTGLLNDELALCHNHLIIPSHPDYMSLNLAAAVQVIAYECRLAILAKEQEEPLRVSEHDRFATAAEMEAFFQHLTSVLTKIEFFKPENPKRLLPRMRRLLNRFHLENMELRLLRGILSAIDKKLLREP